MQLVQFEVLAGRRLGLLDAGGHVVLDITAARPLVTRTWEAFAAAEESGQSLPAWLTAASQAAGVTRLDFDILSRPRTASSTAWLRPPLDHADPHRVLVTGTGLTHLGSMKSRDQMHAQLQADEATLSDSKKMFLRGVRGGKPAAGQRGESPEWFYKGDGGVLRGPHEPLDLPAFALDGGEEPELAGCYVIDKQGRPRRLGMVLGNEWSDHETEQINYLYLAPSKLRTCAIGPVLVLGHDFQEIELRCTVRRGGETLYDSGPLYSGEQHMVHTRANCEDHHFKYPSHRRPGDLHVHYFGTSQLSHSTRKWKYADGDEIQIEAPAFSPPLVNQVRRLADEGLAVVQPA